MVNLGVTPLSPIVYSPVPRTPSATQVPYFHDSAVLVSVTLNQIQSE